MKAREIGQKLLEKEARKFDVVLKRVSDEDFQRVARYSALKLWEAQ